MKSLGKKQLLKKDHLVHCIITCLTSLIYICYYNCNNAIMLWYWPIITFVNITIV